jgi:misacylated tRNA(Ala) deacylase
MAMHTSLHLLCATLAFSVTGGSISPEKSRLDFDTQGQPMPHKDEISEKLNNLAQKNLTVTPFYTDWEFLDLNPHIVRTLSVQPPRNSESLRLVRIGPEHAPVDLQPCGGTHVASTKDIPTLKVAKIENKGQLNKRVTIVFS